MEERTFTTPAWISSNSAACRPAPSDVGTNPGFSATTASIFRACRFPSQVANQTLLPGEFVVRSNSKMVFTRVNYCKRDVKETGSLVCAASVLGRQRRCSIHRWHPMHPRITRNELAYDRVQLYREAMRTLRMRRLSSARSPSSRAVARRATTLAVFSNRSSS
jgi:hypothetical protein